ATPSIVEFVVVGMQKDDARMPPACGIPSVRSPEAWPVVLMHCELLMPKAPGVFCAGQKFPVALVSDTVPVLSGFRVTASGAWNAPPPRVGGQSWLVLVLPPEMHEPPAFGP